jgi:hypothetical protein
MSALVYADRDTVAIEGLACVFAAIDSAAFPLPLPIPCALSPRGSFAR